MNLTEHHLATDYMHYCDANNAYAIKLIAPNCISKYNKLSTKYNFKKGPFFIIEEALFAVSFDDSSTGIVTVSIYDPKCEIPPEVYLKQRFYNQTFNTLASGS